MCFFSLYSSKRNNINKMVSDPSQFDQMDSSVTTQEMQNQPLSLDNSAYRHSTEVKKPLIERSLSTEKHSTIHINV